LTVGYWQSLFKVGDHGEVHELEYTLKNNGGTKTEKSEENGLKFMHSIADMPNRKNVKWFDHGTYQGGTDREFAAIHIYDRDNQVIAVFKKATGKFVTTCRLTDLENDELMKTGNFGGGKDWFSGKVNNLPLASPENNLGTTPIDKSSSITPINSFESDITGVTPIDNSQMDNP